MKHARVGVLTAVAGLGLVGLTACGSDNSSTPVTVPPVQQQQTVPDADAPRANLVAADVGALGKVVTNQKGMTLYRFDKDTADPPVSNCSDACASQWPPLLVEGKELTFSGVDQSMVGWIKRKDGTKQVTINKWPVYMYTKDAAPGDAVGQGMGGTWFAVTPEGKKAQGTATGGIGASGAAKPQQQQPKPQQQKPADQPTPAAGGDTGSGY